MESKEMLKKLHASGYGEFPDGQLRTLQRRVRLWRMRVVQQLVYGADASAGIKAASRRGYPRSSRNADSSAPTPSFDFCVR
jgi:hypothetical protein